MMFKGPLLLRLGMYAAALLLTAALNGANLRVILVGDTASQDLQSSINVDLQTIETHAAEVAKYTGLSLSVARIVARDACSQGVLDYLHGLQVSNDDVLLFYFSGHGYRTPSKGANPWPNIYFSVNQTGIDLEEIGNILGAKPARLAIVLADCCNSSLPNNLAPPVEKVRQKPQPSEEKVRRNFRKLFLDARGLVLVASSKAGQPSWSIARGGSLYTSAYSDTFKLFVKQVNTDILDWQQALDHAAYKTHQAAIKNGISQDPIYTVK